ncbi:unnamed protein product [Protopolystoma xenopodis]|uniref:Uncharacterized protein n=1 Tax=Protopolystoma xenopodis TaxID=117903 RepID=A0A448WTQ2_9PLAT|nr:unnamed protein product [Protopolystoma xenopodis]
MLKKRKRRKVNRRHTEPGLGANESASPGGGGSSGSGVGGTPTGATGSGGGGGANSNSGTAAGGGFGSGGFGGVVSSGVDGITSGSNLRTVGSHAAVGVDDVPLPVPTSCEASASSGVCPGGIGVAPCKDSVRSDWITTFSGADSKNQVIETVSNVNTNILPTSYLAPFSTTVSPPSSATSISSSSSSSSPSDAPNSSHCPASPFDTGALSLSSPQQATWIPRLENPTAVDVDNGDADVDDDDDSRETESAERSISSRLLAPLASSPRPNPLPLRVSTSGREIGPILPQRARSKISGISSPQSCNITETTPQLTTMPSPDLAVQLTGHGETFDDIDAIM